MSEKTWIDIVDDAMGMISRSKPCVDLTDEDLELYYELARLRLYLWTEEDK